MSVSNSHWRDITKTTTPKRQLKISTEMQRTSSLRSSVNEKQNFKKTKIVADNMSSIKKESSKDKIFVSSSLWRNTNKTKALKPLLKATPIEISTEMWQSSPLKSSVKEKQAPKKSTLAVDKMPTTKKESSNDKKSRSNLLGKIATNPVKSQYYLRSKNMRQMASSKSFVEEKKIPKNVTIAVKKVQSRQKVTAKVKKLPSKFPRKEVTKAEILNFIFRPEYRPQQTSSKSSIMEKQLLKKDVSRRGNVIYRVPEI